MENQQTGQQPDGPETWVGRQAYLDGVMYRVASAERAIGTLVPPGATQPLRLRSTYEVHLVDGPVVYGCAWCQLLKRRRQQVSWHLGQCSLRPQGRRTPGSRNKGNRVPESAGQMTISEMLRLLGRVEQLELTLKDERSMRKAAEKALNTIRKAAGERR